MALLIKLSGNSWDQVYDYPSIEGNYISLARAETICAGADLAINSAVGDDWHIDSVGRHGFIDGETIIDFDSLVFVPPNPEFPGDEGYYEEKHTSILAMIESVAGVGSSVLMHRFAPTPEITEPRFWTGLQLSVEIP